ncbi:sensor histidine kinase/response regulator [Myxococcus stipitatus DSM 14675]|uniref:histidine kinase n=1 Tax=Myxococcus stipitatus (strain DSM 14675 / JCM 12634 / Mx s8) TaxID=1278073 RepID=L7UDF0_MYXSD|nr:response regulator [Myxococcus stipitatus]AGC46921.1 sensor histidine kinase/response regulator [Myxococcus stipitatus DSM 14675]
MNPSERLLRQFRDLVTVRLERINRALMELEAGANVESGRGALRELHGLKGEARMMGFDDINSLVHEMEELVRCAEPKRYLLSADSTDALLSAADAVLLLSGAPPSSGTTSPEVERLVGWLQACIRAEAERLPPGAAAPEGGEAKARDLSASSAALARAASVGAEAKRVAPQGEGAGGTSVEPPVQGEPGTGPGLGRKGGIDDDARRARVVEGGGGTARAGTIPPVVTPRSEAGVSLTTPGTSTTAATRGWPSAPRAEATPARGTPALPGAGLLLTTTPVSSPGARTSATKAHSVPRQPETRLDAVRIDVASLDLLTSAVTNLSQIARRRERAHARRLALARELGQLAREAEDLGPAAAALVARLGTAKELAADLHRESKLLSNEELRDLGQVVEEVQGLRMLPLSVLFEPYPRMVRDLSRALGKEVELVVDGEDTRADRAVVEALREPLMHLVRNALDHGLETRVDRVTSGKHPRGCLTLRAAREGSRIILRVEDDGLGLDPAELRRVAVRRGILDESAANALSDAATRELIFLPGFTSRDVVTDLSGRGVGLDAVRASVQGLGGDVGVESAPGWGTIFELRVPVSLTVAPLLFVQVGHETLALSATHVSRALKVEPLHLCEVAGRPALLVEGRVLPLASLGALLGLSPEREVREGELVLVVRSQSGAAAVVVDRVLEERVQAILPLRGVLARFAHLTGATSLADGRLAMVLSAAYLTASAHGTSPVKLPRSTPVEPESRRRRVLVVDDSPLTRELISSLLEAVGYDTVVAGDGAEALDVLEGPPVDLVVTDLEMPGMDGLELTRRLKGHPTQSRLPVVILTTRGGEEDRRRGLSAGADGYITKGDLVRQDLVDVVGRLLS